MVSIDGAFSLYILSGITFSIESEEVGSDSEFDNMICRFHCWKRRSRLASLLVAVSSVRGGGGGGGGDTGNENDEQLVEVEDSDGVDVDDHIFDNDVDGDGTDQENNINDKEGHLAIRSIVATSAPPLMEERKTKGNSKLVSNDDDNDDDDERYSRQLLTLGARAHSLVRSATIVLDGPLGGSSRRRRFERKKAVIEPTEDDVVGDAATIEVPSGLLYEITKNLALSGVGRIVLVYDDDDTPVDIGYFDGSLDDLGAAYRRAVLAEIAGIDNYRHGDDDTD